MPHPHVVHLDGSYSLRVVQPRAAQVLRLAALALALLPGPGSAATIGVTTSSDEHGTNSSSCSLREAITAANTDAAFGGCTAGSGADVIQLPAATYQLTLANAAGLNEDENATGDLDINTSLTIQGAGAATTFIQAGSDPTNGIDKVLGVNPYCLDAVNVTIQGVTIRYGRNTQTFGAADFGFTGGGLDHCGGADASTFTISDSVVADNTAENGYGGGLNIDNINGYTGTISLIRTTFRNNRTLTTSHDGNGGAVNVWGYRPNVYITECVFVGNTTAGPYSPGGAIAFRTVHGGSLHVQGSTVDGNEASASGGGGIAISPPTADTVIEIGPGTRITSNSSVAGGGVYVDGYPTDEPILLSGVTITGNSDLGTAPDGGGGLWIGRAHVTLEHSRIANNVIAATSGGTGLYKSDAPGTVTGIDDWWGCSAGPAAAPCDTAVIAAASSGSLVTSPFLRVTTTATPDTIAIGESSSVVASFATNSSGQDVSGDLAALVGAPISWQAEGGTLSGQQPAIQADGTATAVYTATSAGANRIAARVDGDGATSGSNVATVTVIASADLSLTLTDSPDPVAAGAVLTYSMTVRNDGPSAAASVSVSDALPAGTTFQSLSTPAGWTATTPAVGSSGTVTLSHASLPAGGAAVFTLAVRADAGIADGTALTNTAMVSSAAADPNPSNDTASATTAVQARADLAITIADAPDPVTAGELLTYTLGVSSAGPSTARNVVITVPVPGGATFTSASVVSGSGWSISAPAVGQAGDVIFTRSAVAPGETASFTVAVTAVSGTSGGTSLSAEVTVAADTADPVPASNSASATTTVSTRADLAVSLADSPDPVTAGESATYTVSLSNAGPNAAQGVAVAASVPSGTTFASATVTAGAGWSVSTPAVGEAGTVTFTKSAVASGETASFTIVVAVASGTGDGTSISAGVTAAADTPDPAAANNAASAATSVLARADLAIALSDAPDPVAAGQRLTWNVDVVNDGPSDARDVVVSLPMPDGTSFASAEVAAGAGWSLAAPEVGQSGLVTFSRPALASAETASFAVVVTVSEGLAGSTLTAQATVGATSTDDDPTDDAASTATSVVEQGGSSSGCGCGAGGGGGEAGLLALLLLALWPVRRRRAV